MKSIYMSPCSCGCTQVTYLGLQETLRSWLPLFNCFMCGTTRAFKVGYE